MFTKKWMCVAVVAAAMALSASMASASTITVLNGSFENPVTAAPGQSSDPWTDGTWAFMPAPWTANTSNWGRAYQPNLGIAALTGGGVQVVNVTDSGYDVVTQPLGSYSFDAGDTLSVTFYLLRDEYGTQGGILRASFLDGATTLVSQDFEALPHFGGTPEVVHAS